MSELKLMMVWYVRILQLYLYVYINLFQGYLGMMIEPDFSPETASQEGSSTSTAF